ncbi:hypothetical protein EW026_g3436 [Hermanssonia centrifuga]|uniref:Uncharacterized protein n=1 Tax=Hermanssonia centrifuga TaxID=98765 RepID=A0A4S4KK64_9APHY|nr:hypothetical protein EW026_g3436 [Hermanssonia centrifuga]
MSDSEHDASVLGKRSRNGHDDSEMKEANVEDTRQEEEESDDDVGPMPMPADALEDVIVKKKRKGTSASIAALGNLRLTPDISNSATS